MKIAYIAAGAGGMYCGSCLHDNTLAAAIQRAGHPIALIPTYTPLRTDEDNVSVGRVFFGGLAVYLREKVPLLRAAPMWLDRVLNRPRLLTWLSKYRDYTDARELGALTVSILQGERGHQRKELEELADWLATAYRPDVVHLTNSLFAGLARELKRRLNVPVVCSFQGEDLFLQQLPEPYREQARHLIRERAADVDAFIATSEYYASFMADYLAVPRHQIEVVYLGINLDGHGNEELRLRKVDPVVGYLARICPEKGLHLLVEAFEEVRRAFPGGVQLKVAGYLAKKDAPYLRSLVERIERRGWREDFEYVGEVDRLGKIVFLNSLDVLSVPTVYRESKGLFVLEALANGVPVVQPRHGLFPEILRATGGGRLVEPNSPGALAEELVRLLQDAALREHLGRHGQQAVRARFGAETMAAETLAIYEKVLAGWREPQRAAAF